MKKIFAILIASLLAVGTCFAESTDDSTFYYYEWEEDVEGDLLPYQGYETKKDFDLGFKVFLEEKAGLHEGTWDNYVVPCLKRFKWQENDLLDPKLKQRMINNSLEYCATFYYEDSGNYLIFIVNRYVNEKFYIKSFKISDWVL